MKFFIPTDLSCHIFPHWLKDSHRVCEKGGLFKTRNCLSSAKTMVAPPCNVFLLKLSLSWHKFSWYFVNGGKFFWPMFLVGWGSQLCQNGENKRKTRLSRKIIF